MKKSTLFIFICSFYIAACQSQNTHQCAFPYSKHKANDRCGYLKVLQDRNDPESPVTRLAYLVISAEGKNTKKDPVIFLQGGPGGVSLPLADNFSNLNIDKSRDFILFDQRGTGFSDPICPDLGKALIEILGMDLTPEQEAKLLIEKTSTCQQTLKGENIKLSDYSTNNNIADLEALRQHLGYNKWNLLAGSYGTRVALSYMEKHPTNIRSSILLSVFPPHLRFYKNIVSNFNNAIDYLFTLCEDDPNCVGKYPNLENDFLSVIQKLEKEPISLETNNGTFVVNTQDFLLLIHQMMYNKITMVQIPAIIQSILSGNDALVNSIVSNLNQRISFINLAVYWSVMVSDEGSFNNKHEFEKDLKQYPKLHTGLSLFNTDPLILENWRQTNNKSVDAVLEPVKSNVPTLMVSGGFDPITPPRYATLAAENMDNAQTITFAKEGHTPFNRCFFKIANNFLNDPEEEINTSCIQNNSSLNWW